MKAFVEAHSQAVLISLAVVTTVVSVLLILRDSCDL